MTIRRQIFNAIEEYYGADAIQELQYKMSPHTESKEFEEQLAREAFRAIAVLLDKHQIEY